MASTSDVRTHGHTMTGGNCTREAGTSSTLSCWRNLGRRRWTSGRGEPSPNFPSGSVSDLVRSLESPSLLTTMMKARVMLLLGLLMKKRRRRKRKKKMNKLTLLIENYKEINPLNPKKKKKKNPHPKKKKKKKKKKKS